MIRHPAAKEFVNEALADLGDASEVDFNSAEEFESSREALRF